MRPPTTSLRHLKTAAGPPLRAAPFSPQRPRRPRHLPVAATLILAHLFSPLTGNAPAADPPAPGNPVAFYATLRDGSVLRVHLAAPPPLLWHPDKAPLKLDDVADLAFSPAPAGDSIREIRRLVAALSSEVFATRESASANLLKIAPGFTDLLAELSSASTDPETRRRLTSILAKVPATPSAPSAFDLLVTAGGKRLSGDLGDWSTAADFRGHTLELSRKNTAKLSLSSPTSPPPFPADSAAPAEFTALRADADDALPPDLFRTGFEADPAGVPLKIGEDISARFSAAGFHISTSVKGTVVSVNDFVVQGRSKGLSAATHAPLWEGTLTIRFHLPGNPEVPASVSAAGFWIASVMPGGTSLEAYGTGGNLVGSVKTTLSGNEFLAFRSPVPISEIRIVPNIPVDPNYTIDDLFFTRPTPLGIQPQPGWATLLTRSGERLLARTWSADSHHFLLGDISFGARQIRLDLPEVSAFAPPRPAGPPAQKDAPDDLHWILLKDGSRLRATRAGFPEHRWAHSSHAKIPPLEITALWGKSQSLRPPPDSLHDFLRASQRAVTPDPVDPARWLNLTGASLGETWVDSPDRLPVHPTYQNSPPVWFSIPKEPAPGTGHLLFTSGDQITLSPAPAAEKATTFLSLDAEAIVLRVAGNPLRISWADVTSCHYPSSP